MSLGIRLTHKIGALGAVGVLGLVVIGGLYLLSSSTQIRYQKMADDAGALAMLTSKLSNQMLQARRAEKDFLLRHEDRYVKAHGEIVRTITSNLDDIAKRLVALDQADLAQKLTPARVDYDSYAKHFAVLADVQRKNGLTENDGLQGTLRKSVHDVESTLKEFNDARLEAGMLAMRRHEKDYMLRGDAKYSEEFKKAATAFAGILAGSDIPAANKAAITLKLAAYQRDFLAYMDGTQAVGRETKALSDAYAKFDPQITAIEHAIEKLHEEASTAASAVTTTATLQIQIALGSGLNWITTSKPR